MSDNGWTTEFATGDPLVDSQHRNIHQLVDYVEAAEDRPDEVLRVLDRLMAHVDVHFATEEALMQRSGFGGEAAEAHVREHRALTNASREMVLRFRTGELTSTAPLVQFLRQWLAIHVHVHDRDFIDFVKARSLQAEIPEGLSAEPGTASC